MKRILDKIFIISLLVVAMGCSEKIENATKIDSYPTIFPDYTEVTVPASIAPLNFRPAGDFERISLVIEGDKGSRIEIVSSDYFSIPNKQWKQLLKDNTGGEIRFTVCVKQSEKWSEYQSFPVYISPEPIDYGLAYRLIAPGYEVYSKMGIYQRNLSDFTQKPVIENTLIPGSCVNCHSFNQTRSDRMSLHIRGSKGGTIISSSENLTILDTKTEKAVGSCVYPYWHPSGKFIAYSVNKTQQAFHSAMDELVEVLDLASDVVVYDPETQELLTCPLLETENLETFPVFSPDGNTLYFCSAEMQKIPEDYKKIRYNLLSIAFDPVSKTFGDKVDTLISADVQGKSVSFPKPSFDGKFIMFTMLDYGNFGIWHKEADLYLLDLREGTVKELTAANSNFAESYHNWSSNSRWFVFASRRTDDLYSRPYIASIDENGNAGKPFLLPQKNPNYYLDSFYSFNVPEFIDNPVKLNLNKAEKLINSGERVKLKKLQ
ncbi:MAG: hypothetical protein LBR13_01180 [Dysgonamonadaceae bacterium]|jgi:hypothetical protein|nr:hypothetical protein [Dysgonamonadaceae bacterium]